LANRSDLRPAARCKGSWSATSACWESARHSPSAAPFTSRPPHPPTDTATTVAAPERRVGPPLGAVRLRRYGAAVGAADEHIASLFVYAVRSHLLGEPTRKPTSDPASLQI